MKIAVYYDLAPGGAAAALGRFVEHLRRAHDVDVFAPLGAHPVAAGVVSIGRAPAALPRHLYYLNRVTSLRRFLDLRRWEWELAARLENYDRVLVHSCRDRGAPALLDALGERAAFYVTEPLRLYREPRPSDAAPAWLWSTARLAYRSAARRLNRADAHNGARAGALLANSAYTAEAVRAIYGRDSEVVYPAVDPLFLNAGAAGGEHDFVLSPGALVPQKGHGRVVRALAAWPRPPELVVAGYRGSESYRARLRRLAARHGVALRVVLDPPSDALRALVASARVVAIAAVREPFGLVSLEAQAQRRAVVVVKEGGLPETVVAGQTGLVAEPDSRSLADSIRLLWDDRPLRERLGSAGFERVRSEFAVDRCGERLASALLPARQNRPAR